MKRAEEFLSNPKVQLTVVRACEALIALTAFAVWALGSSMAGLITN